MYYSSWFSLILVKTLVAVLTLVFCMDTLQLLLELGELVNTWDEPVDAACVFCLFPSHAQHPAK